MSVPRECNSIRLGQYRESVAAYSNSVPDIAARERGRERGREKGREEGREGERERGRDRSGRAVLPTRPPVAAYTSSVPHIA
eukprot:3941439-Rhodomonas_salina.2